VKRRLGIPADATACHTAQVGDYLIEGHVPAETIDRMLSEKPAVAGIAAPGMPPGSPGMAPPGSPEGGYDVVSFTKNGKIELYERR
jgi:hypothetical protein